jgi:hypothetical protein
MNNGISPYATPQDLLDRVLAGKPDEVKARVLELVLRLGINPQDELFLVMIALNHLQLLVEDAPTEWQDLFIDFKGELDQWSDTNLNVLDSLIHKAKNEEALAESCKQLISALANLTISSNELVKQLQNQPQTSSVLSQELTYWFKDLSQKIGDISTQQTLLLTRMEKAIALTSRKWNAKIKFPGWLVALLFFLTATSVGNMWLLLVKHP